MPPDNSNWRCLAHEQLARDIGELVEATRGLRDRLKDHRRDLDKDIGTINKSIARLAKANGLKGERIATVETKVAWLAAIVGMAGGALVNFVLWLFREQ